MQHFLLEVGTTTASPITSTFIPLILMVAVFYFIIIRPQKKRDKETALMRNAIEVGDEIITNGGIIGRVVSVREESLVIESGSSNTKLRITKWAVQANNTAQERLQDEAKARKAEKEEGKRKEKEDE